MDRNTVNALPFRAYAVALLAEGVDRNQVQKYYEELARVALLAEGVDRNLLHVLLWFWLTPRSPSSRRAWIEIIKFRDWT